MVIRHRSSNLINYEFLLAKEILKSPNLSANHLNFFKVQVKSYVKLTIVFIGKLGWGMTDSTNHSLKFE